MNPNDPNNNSVPTPAPQAPVPPAPIEPSSQPQAVASPMAAPATVAPLGVNPGKGLGLASLITSLLGLGLVGLILGIIGLKKSKQAGMSNTLALIGIILGVLGMISAAFILLIAFNGVAEVANEIVAACENSISGVVTLSDGSSYTCPQ